MGKEGVYGDSELSLELFCKPKKKKKKIASSSFLDLRPTESQFPELKPRTLHF